MEEFWHALLEQWSHGATQIFEQIGAAKVWAFAIPLVPAAYGVWVKWRNSGYRMLDRLEEFVKQQEKRVKDAREELAKHAVIPLAYSPHDQPAFNARGLAISIRKMNWGFGPTSVGKLHEAAQVSAQRALLSKQQSEEHLKRQALVHLLIGAKEAARDLKDPQVRASVRGAALKEFEKALAISPDDPDALQYSGLMLLQLARPVEAADRFTRLVELRQSADGKLLADAYRLLATAYENYPGNGKLRLASGELTRALRAASAENILELALIHEHQGWVRKKMRAQKAIDSFREAARLFATLEANADGRDGARRVTEAIALLNAEEASTTPDIEVAANN
ncbi:MAG: hypothetical protein K2X41_08345 [Hyphomicrobium sp.]|nr:hypothetical protein [Hyphomicrobium sp.]